MTDFSFLENNPNTYKYNLWRRSQGIPATRFEWDNALKADGVPILARRKETAIDPNIKVEHNLFSQIQEEKSSYIGANIEVTFGADIKEDVIKKYADLERRCYLKTLLKELVEDCSGWGNTYLLSFLDYNNRVSLKKIYSWNTYIDEDTGNGYVTEYQKKKDGTLTDNVKIYEYDNTNCRIYSSTASNIKSALYQGEFRHGFGLMPLVEFPNNKNRTGNSEKSVYLLDAYDRLTADNLTEWGSLRQAYLLLKDMGDIDKATAKEFKRLAMIIGRNENSDARFITKNLNPDFARFITERTWSSIWSTASIPDPNVLESLSNVTAFQISQLYRRLDNNCNNLINEWQKSLQQLDDVLASYWTGLDIDSVQDYDTYQIDYKFNKNIPIDVMTYLKDLKEAGALLPQREILIKAGYSETEAEDIQEQYKQENGKEMNNDK
ncbi:MAG: phage portal protein [Heliobacteriaceae bacterium]|jgi:SPP1 family phage portal protein|nr:phage portal protein [Heliobacteriaceae bacterium]